jgi:hypothetical protein
MADLTIKRKTKKKKWQTKQRWSIRTAFLV